MNEEIYIEDNEVVQKKLQYCAAFGGYGAYEVHTVITKDVFVECFRRWILDDWLSSFNTDSATACFTAVQQLKNKGGFNND